jgi:hypothetical protein
MADAWFLAALWLLLALVAVLIANWLHVSTALSEIVVGTVAQLVIGAVAGSGALGSDAVWIAFLAGTGAIVLTFLAGAELDPEVFRAKWKESTAVGLIGFFAPFFGAAGLVEAQFEHHRVDHGDRSGREGDARQPGRAPFPADQIVRHEVVSAIVFVALPFVTPWFFERWGGRVSELESHGRELWLAEGSRQVGTPTG